MTACQSASPPRPVPFSIPPSVTALLSLSRLSLASRPRGESVRTLVSEVNLQLRKGEALGLIGGLGAGKTVLLQSLTGLLPPRIRITGGSALLDPGSPGEIDLSRFPAWRMRRLRRNRIAILCRDAAGQWNPKLTVRQHLRETLDLADLPSDRRAEADWMPTLYEAGLIEPENLLGLYPRQLPGVVLQRFTIAMGLLKGADLWIADEPTSDLDATGEDQILRLLRDLCEKRQFGLLFATHHFGVIGRLAHRVAVLFEGAIVETGEVDAVLRGPAHRYTRALLDCLPALGDRRSRLGEVDRVAERDALDTAGEARNSGETANPG